MLLAVLLLPFRGGCDVGRNSFDGVTVQRSSTFIQHPFVCQGSSNQLFLYSPLLQRYCYINMNLSIAANYLMLVVAIHSYISYRHEMLQDLHDKAGE